MVVRGPAYWPLIFAISACDNAPPPLAANADDADDAAASTDAPPDAQTHLVQPLARARKRLRFIGKGSEHLGWKLSAIAKMYSLAGALDLPEWSAGSDQDLRRTRDDDLRTAWTCPQTRTDTCALGIHFPEPATVVAVRISASPDASQTPKDFARVRTLRVHTDEGWAEDRFEPGYEDLYLRFGEPVTTRQLSVEIVETEKKEGGTVRIAEFDVFGTAGDARAPIELDGAAAYVQMSQPPWKKSGRARDLNRTTIDYLGADGRTRTLCSGSAAYFSGDRFMLVERLSQTKCESSTGSYQFVDLKTHVRFSLGDLGGLPGDTWLHKSGNGFAVGYVDEDITRVHAVLFSNDKYMRKKSSRASRDTYHEVFEQWKISEAVVPRGGGRTVDDPPASCAAATAEQFARLQAARVAPGSADASPKKRKRSASGAIAGPADRWMACDLGEGILAFTSSGQQCSKRWDIVLVNAAGTLLARAGDTTKGARIRARRSAEHEIFVEVGGNSNAVQLFSVRADTIESLGIGSALAVSPPASCNDRCDTPFVNARAG